LTQAATVVAAEDCVLQIIPKNMNNNITDNGTPNNHIIIIRVMNQTFTVMSQEKYSTRGQCFSCCRLPIQQLPCHCIEE